MVGNVRDFDLASSLIKEVVLISVNSAIGGGSEKVQDSSLWEYAFPGGVEIGFGI